MFQDIIKIKKDSNAGPYLAKFTDPLSLLSEIGLEKGMKVAHFGCGSGYFTYAAAEKVGAEGKVWAFDILEQKLDLVKSQARILNFGNIIVQKANLEKKEGSGLPAESVDWVLVINMLFQNLKKSPVIGEAKRVLKKGGRILIVEWDASSKGSVGPEGKARVSREEIIKIIRKYGFEISKEVDAGNFHWGMVVKK